WFTIVLFFFFFFQAEDGIRDLTVTGVETCALPIYRPPGRPGGVRRNSRPRPGTIGSFEIKRCSPDRARCAQLRHLQHARRQADRSEERRVGKVCRTRWWAEREKKKRTKKEKRKARE